MSRKKKEDKTTFLYCDKRKCPRTDCLRHNNNIPFGRLVLVERFNEKKDWDSCKDYLGD